MLQLFLCWNVDMAFCTKSINDKGYKENSLGTSLFGSPSECAELVLFYKSTTKL
jgi:hypothetical protein